MCKVASQAVLGRMQLILYATRRTPQGASRLVQAVSPWSMKTRHAPYRRCRNARVYGHTTTAMHDIEYISPIEYTPGEDASDNTKQAKQAHHLPTPRDSFSKDKNKIK